MFRDGAGEYEINGTALPAARHPGAALRLRHRPRDARHRRAGPARLRCCSRSPEDRRAYIEEAAGVLKHRKRKEKALRKLDAMQANLTRLTDLTAELRRQLKPLGRQAEIARRAQAVQADLRDARLRLAADDLVTLRGELAREEADEAARAGPPRRGRGAARRSARAEQERLEAGARRGRAAAGRRAGHLVPALGAGRAPARHRRGWPQERARHLARRRRRARAGPRPRRAGRRGRARRRAGGGAGRGGRGGARQRARGASPRQRAEHEATLAAAERAHLAAVRALADRRAGLATLAGRADALRSGVAANAEEIERLSEALAEAQERTARRATPSSRAPARRSAPSPRATTALDERVAEAASRRTSARAGAVAELVARRAGGRAAAGALAGAGRGARGRAWPAATASGALLGDGGRTGVLGARVRRWSRSSPRPGRGRGGAGRAGRRRGGRLGSTPRSPPSASCAPRDAGAGRRCSSAADAGAGGRRPVADATSTRRRAAPCRRRGSGGGPLGAAASAPDVLAAGAVRPGCSHGVVVVGRPRTAARDRSPRPGSPPSPPTATCSGRRASGGSGAGGRARWTCRPPWTRRASGAATASRRSWPRLRPALDGARAEEAARLADLEAARRAPARPPSSARGAAAAQLGRLEQAVRAADAEAERLRGPAATRSRRAAPTRLLALEAAEQRLAVAEDEPRRGRAGHRGSGTPPAEPLGRRARREIEARLALRTAEERARALAGRADSLRAPGAGRAPGPRAGRGGPSRPGAAARGSPRLVVAAGQTACARDRRVAGGRRRRARRGGRRPRPSGSAPLGRGARQVAARLTACWSKLTDAVHRDEVLRAQHAAAAGALTAKVLDDLGLGRGRPRRRVRAATCRCPPSAAERRSTRRRASAARSLTPRRCPTTAPTQQRRAQRAEKDLALLGRVNPLALEEFAALEERYRFLVHPAGGPQEHPRATCSTSSARSTTRSSRCSPRPTGRRARVRDVFATLFPGGEGRLVLTDPDDMLTTGIEVEARPPGKKVKRLSLLSGGERSLTAMALLVAIFRARPSPFYVLDEVEAALDDVNLGRLISLMGSCGRLSQLIVITHQKPTMEVADALYGVSMRGDGITTVISQRLRAQRADAAERRSPGIVCGVSEACDDG